MSLQSLLVDLAAGADSWKRACRVVAVANLTLSGEQTIDSVAVVEGERVLATAQTLTAMNGPWVCALGAWTRPADFDASSKVVFGTKWFVSSGTVYSGTTWAMTSPVSGTPSLGVTALTIAQDGYFSAALAAVYTYTPSTASIKAATATFIRGVTTGGWLFTPGADGAVSTAAAVNADGTTAKPIALTATTATVNAGTQVQAQQDGTARVTDTVAAAYVRSYAATCTSITDSIAQHGSAAGIARTLRGQQGFAGQVGGDFVTGAGDGGTTGTNAPGVYRIKTGTPVANVGGRYSLEHEDGTKYFEVKQSASGVTQIAGGPIGAETHNLLFRTTNVQFETTSGFITLVSAADVYLDHGTGYFYHRENGVTVATQKNDADGASYINWITGVTSVELRHNTSPRVAFDSTTVTLSADEVVRESAAGTVYQRERVATATISSATTTTVDSFTTTSNRVYLVWSKILASNDTDNEMWTAIRVAAFRNVAGTLTQIGTTLALSDPLGPDEIKFRDAGQSAITATIDASGTAIRMRFTTDAADTVNVNTVTTITERVLA